MQCYRKVWVFCILMATISPIFGAPIDTLLWETFRFNHRGWRIPSEAKITEGGLEISPTPNPWNIVTHVPWKDNHPMEIIWRWETDTLKGIVKLGWSDDSQNNAWVGEVSTSGFQVRCKRNGNLYSQPLPWHSDTPLTTVEVRMQAENGKLNWWINGKIRFSSNIDFIPGHQIFIQGDGGQTLRIKSLLILGTPIQEAHLNSPCIRNISPGENVNSKRGEYQPRIHSSGELIWFLREQPLGKNNFRKEVLKEDVWFTNWENSTWQEPEIWNSIPHGKTLPRICGHGFGTPVLTWNYLSESNLKIEERWKDSIEVQYLQGMGENWPFGEYSVSMDGQFVVMALAQKGGFEKDLYVSRRSGAQTWMAPQKLPSPINSSLSEHSPFLAADLKTLYFAAEGRGGNGSSDVYLTRRKDDSWKNWSVPIRLSKDINTESWEGYFSISANGEKACWSWIPQGQALPDIQCAILPMEARPEPVLLSTLLITDKETGVPLSVKVRWGKTLTATAAGSSPLTLYLPTGPKTIIQIQSEGYLSKDTILTPGGNLELKLDSLRKGYTQILEGIEFYQSSTKCKPGYMMILDQWQKWLKQNPMIKVELSGHTDNVGDTQMNLDLSKSRAEVLKQYLVNKGISSERIFTQGYGSAFPRGDNTTEAGRRLNRRVEIKIL